jgi:DNA repair protein RadC
MNQYHNDNLKKLISESLRERQDSYIIQEIFHHFPTTVELIEYFGAVEPSG